MKNNPLVYYTVHTDEDKEFRVFNQLLKIFPVVFVPIQKHKVVFNSLRFNYFERIMPEYVIFGAESTSLLSSVSSLDGVERLLDESIPSNEVKSFLPSITRHQEINKIVPKTEVVISNGEYYKKFATVQKVFDDKVDLVVSVNSNPRITLTLWDIAVDI